MTCTDRQTVYSIIFAFLIIHKIDTLPLPIETICKRLCVDLVPLSKIVRETGLSKDEIFHIWGNEDGAVSCYRAPNGETLYRIAFNDSKTDRRIRFTIAEELSHIILGHTADPDFNVYCQSYKNEVYDLYDQQARICAGILLCPPNYYYNHEKDLNREKLMQVCEITEACAKTRQGVFNRFRDEILSTPLYDQLPPQQVIIQA